MEAYGRVKIYLHAVNLVTVGSTNLNSWREFSRRLSYVHIKWAVREQETIQAF
jgi:hypothetical protein